MCCVKAAGGDDVARAAVLENLGAWGAEGDVRGDVVGGCSNTVWKLDMCNINSITDLQETLALYMLIESPIT
jgi:hypothetical protein